MSLCAATCGVRLLNTALNISAPKCTDHRRCERGTAVCERQAGPLSAREHRDSTGRTSNSPMCCVYGVFKFSLYGFEQQRREKDCRPQAPGVTHRRCERLARAGGDTANTRDRPADRMRTQANEAIGAESSRLCQTAGFAWALLIQTVQYRYCWLRGVAYHC